MTVTLPFRPQTIHHATGLEEPQWNLTAVRRDYGMRSASASGGVRRLSAGFRLAPPFSTGCARAPAPRARRRGAPRAIAEPARSSSSRDRAGRLTYDAVNACILLLGQLDGAELVTIEDLADGDALHPLQQAMVDWHGSQCGFCTPGIVMSLFAAYHSGFPSTRASLNDQLAGNLCRCTGYRPIVEAALATCHGAPDDRFAATAEARVEALARLSDDADLFVGDETSFFAAPAEPRWARRALWPISRRDACRRGDRRRSLDHQAVARLEARDLARQGKGSRRHPRDRRRRAFAGRRLDARRLGAAVRRDPCGSRRTVAPLRLDAGARERNGRGKYRQWVADRRSRPGAHRSRRARRIAQGFGHARAAAWRISLSATAGRTGRLENSFWRSRRRC